MPSFDGRNALNCIGKSHMLPGLTKTLLTVAQYASNLHTWDPPKIFLHMEDEQVLVVNSRRNVRLGCSAGGLELLGEFRKFPLVPGT